MTQQPKPQKSKKTRIVFPVKKKETEYSALNNELYIDEKNTPGKVPKVIGEYSLNVKHDDIQEILTKQTPDLLGIVVEGPQSFDKVVIENKNLVKHQVVQGNNAVYKDDKIHIIGYNNKNLYELDKDGNAYYSNALYSGNEISQKTKVLTRGDLKNRFVYTLNYGNSHSIGNLVAENPTKKDLLFEGTSFTNWTPYFNNMDEKYALYQGETRINYIAFTPDLTDEGLNCLKLIFTNEGNVILSQEEKTKLSNAVMYIDVYEGFSLSGGASNEKINSEAYVLVTRNIYKTQDEKKSYYSNITFAFNLNSQCQKIIPNDYWTQEFELSNGLKVKYDNFGKITSATVLDAEIKTADLDNKDQFVAEITLLFKLPNGTKITIDGKELTWPLNETNLKTLNENFYLNVAMPLKFPSSSVVSIFPSGPDVPWEIQEKIKKAFKENRETYQKQVLDYMKGLNQTTNLIFYYIDTDSLAATGVNEKTLKPFYAFPPGGAGLFQLLNDISDMQDKLIFIGKYEDFYPLNFDKLQLCKIDEYLETEFSTENRKQSTNIALVKYLEANLICYKDYTMDERYKINFEIKKVTTSTGGTDVKGNYHKYTLKFTCVSYNTYFSSPYEPQLAITLDKNNNIVCVNSRWEKIEDRYESKIEGLTLGEEYTVILFYEEYEPVESTPNTGSDTQA